MPDKAREQEQSGLEALNMLSDDVIEKAQKAQAFTSQAGMRALVSWVVRILAIVGLLILTTMLLTWGWHFVTPENLHYLTAAQRDELKDVLFSAALSAFVTSYARRTLG